MDDKARVFVPRNADERKQIVDWCEAAAEAYADDELDSGFTARNFAERVVPPVPVVRRRVELVGCGVAVEFDAIRNMKALFKVFVNGVYDQTRAFPSLVSEYASLNHHAVAQQLLDLIDNPDEPATPQPATTAGASGEAFKPTTQQLNELLVIHEAQMIAQNGMAAVVRRVLEMSARATHADLINELNAKGQRLADVKRERDNAYGYIDRVRANVLGALTGTESERAAAQLQPDDHDMIEAIVATIAELKATLARPAMVRELPVYGYAVVVGLDKKHYSTYTSENVGNGKTDAIHCAKVLNGTVHVLYDGGALPTRGEGGK